jgi:GH25 family lysozyme M1 (1,4-beta-N-acetylmuramidase)
MTVTGIDVCEADGTVDWQAVVGADHRFVYVKASEGAGYRDPRFAENWGRSAMAGLLRGSYHFARPSPRISGGREAAWFVDAMRGVGAAAGGHLPPAVALQWSQGLEPADVLAWMGAFVAELRRRTRRSPMIYAGRFWKTTLGDPPDAWSCPLWLAQYNAEVQLPRAWTEQILWQYTRSGSIPGRPDVHLNTSRFGGSYAELVAFASGAQAGR